MENELYLENENAGFLLRLAAFLIDSIIINIAIYALMFIIGFLGFGGMAAAGGLEGLEPGAEPTPEMMAGFMGFYGVMMIISIVGYWLYFAYQESSPAMATIGKRAVNIKVTDLDGQRISFGRATGRLFGKFISAIILYIGFIMAAFTERKQALHDMMASTLVVKNEI